RAHRRCRAPTRARRAARTTLRRHRAGDSALRWPLVGGLQHAPFRRFSQRRRSVRQAVAAQRAREPVGADAPAPAPRRRRALMRYVLRRLALYAVAAWAAVTLGFVLPRLMPGDPATALLARLRGKLTPAALAAMRDALGFADGSLLHQYTSYWRHLLRGDL